MSKFLPRFFVAFQNTTKFNVLQAQKNTINKNTNKYRLIISESKLYKREDVQSYVNEKIECITLVEHEAIVAGLEKKLAEARYETIKWCAGRILISGKRVAQLFNCNDDIFIELAAAFSEVADEEKKSALAKLRGEV